MFIFKGWKCKRQEYLDQSARCENKIRCLWSRKWTDSVAKSLRQVLPSNHLKVGLTFSDFYWIIAGHKTFIAQQWDFYMAAQYL